MLDLRWLAPLPVEDILREADVTGRVLVVDETRRSGGVSEAVVTALVDGRFGGAIARVTSEDSFIPLGDAARQVLLSEETIEDAGLRLVAGSGSPPPGGGAGDAPRTRDQSGPEPRSAAGQLDSVQHDVQQPARAVQHLALAPCTAATGQHLLEQGLDPLEVAGAAQRRADVVDQVGDHLLRRTGTPVLGVHQHVRRAGAGGPPRGEPQQCRWYRGRRPCRRARPAPPSRPGRGTVPR